jgi:quercetin dioxygenase-like cupin family protein
MSKNKVTKNSREKILALEKSLINISDGVNVEGDGNKIVRDGNIAPIKHTFADGVYVRQMDMKKDTVVVGAIHKHLHVWFLLVGDVTIATEDTTEDYIALCYIVSTPGVKRVIYSNEDSIVVNIHKNPTNTKDLDKLEKEIVALNYEEYEKYINKNK